MGADALAAIDQVDWSSSLMVRLALAVSMLPALGLLGLLVEDEEAERARRLIAAYNAAAPLPGEEPDGFPGVLLC